MNVLPVKDIAGGLASFGRHGDTYMVHAAEGETVVHGARTLCRGKCLEQHQPCYRAA